MVKDTVFLLSSGSGQRSSLILATSVQHILKIVTRAIRQEKEIKSVHTRKEGVKLSLFTDDMILYVENPKNSTKEPQTVKTNTFSKAAG